MDSKLGPHLLPMVEGALHDMAALGIGMAMYVKCIYI